MSAATAFFIHALYSEEPNLFGAAWYVSPHAPMAFENSLVNWPTDWAYFASLLSIAANEGVAKEISKAREAAMVLILVLTDADYRNTLLFMRNAAALM